MIVHILSSYDYPDAAICGIYANEKSAFAEKERLEKLADANQEETLYYVNTYEVIE